MHRGNMAYSDLDKLKFEHMVNLDQAIKDNNREAVNQICISYISKGIGLGLDEKQASDNFITMMQQITEINKKNEEIKKEEIQQLEEQKKAKKLWLISIVLTLLLSVGVFILIFKEDKGDWLITVIVTLCTFSIGFAAINWLVNKLHDLYTLNKNFEAIQKSIAENNKWIWHCQTCGANYSYNGQPDAICGRCHNRLTKVMGMRL